MNVTKKFFIKEIDGIFGVWVNINNGYMVYEIAAFSTKKEAEEHLEKVEGEKNE